MLSITATTYFTNNIMIRRSITLARALVLMSHASAIIPPDADLLEVRSPSQIVLVPDQIIFNVNRAYVPQAPQPTRRSIYNRDEGLCAYCGKWVPYSAASLDHVLPLSQDGPTSWDNLVNACLPCNQRKAGRTPEKAHMTLRFRPYVPKVRLRPE